jgi:nucleoside phosphorylase
MEGYAVACAAAESRVQQTVFRGFSNVVGDRDVINWSIDQALNSVSSLVRSYLEAGEDDHQE